MDVEQIALNLNDIANEIWLNKQTELMQNHPAMQAIMTSSQRDFQSLLNSATSTKEEQKQSISSTLKFKL